MYTRLYSTYILCRYNMSINNIRYVQIILEIKRQTTHYYDIVIYTLPTILLCIAQHLATNYSQ